MPINFSSFTNLGLFMKKMKYFLAAGLISSMSVCFAADNAPKPEVAKLLQARLGPAVPVSELKVTPAEGVYQAQFGSKIAYLTGNGRYIIMGDMIDLQTSQNLTEVSRRAVSKQIIDKVSVDNLAVFPSSADTTKAVLNVFTDTSCPYCKKLHEEVPDLQKAGIEVRYFPFPRGGNRGPGYQTLKQVWCGIDKAKTMDVAKHIQTGELPDANCDEAKFVDVAYKIGNSLGVSGTPALFTGEGEKIEGYVPSAKLIPMLLK